METLLHIEYTTMERLRKGEVKRVRKKIIILVTYIMVALLLFVSFTLDSDFPIQPWQIVLAIVSGVWLVLFVIANSERIGIYE